MIPADQTPLVPPKVLSGLTAGEVDAEDVGSHGRTALLSPAPTVPQLRTDDELRAAIVARMLAFGREDLELLERVAAELPFDRLVAVCQRATREGVEPLGAKNFRTLPTKPVVAMRAALLSALDMLRPLVGLAPRVRGGVGMYLRPPQPTAPGVEKASAR
jgi:hypothetical protein